jgi:phosphatidylglycerophosphate synthase
MKNFFKFLYNGWGAEPIIRSEYYGRINTIPNWITFFGFCACLVYVILALNGFARAWWIFIFYGVAGLSDVLDGFAARLTGQRSRFGEIFDPARDIAIIASQAIHLGILAGFAIFAHPLFIAMVVVESLIGSGGALIGRHYQVKSHTAGKIRRASHSLVLFALCALAMARVEEKPYAGLAFAIMTIMSAQALYFYINSNWAKVYVVAHEAPGRSREALRLIWQTAHRIASIF